MEVKTQKIIEFVKHENYYKPSNEPIAKENNDNNQVNFKKFEDISIQPKKNNEVKGFKISNKILERVQNLERHLNGENEINETNNKAVVDEYMNIILDKPVFNKNKKLKKMVFSDN